MTESKPQPTNPRKIAEYMDSEGRNPYGDPENLDWWRERFAGFENATLLAETVAKNLDENNIEPTAQNVIDNLKTNLELMRMALYE